MIILKAPNEEVIQNTEEHRKMLHKQAEKALDANKKDAEEIEKYHGEDTKKPVTNSDLKAMHLSESLFEDLDVNPNMVNRLIYDLILRVQGDDGALAFDKTRQQAKKKLEDMGYYVEYPRFNRDDAFVSYQVSGTLGTVFKWGIIGTKDFFIRADQRGSNYRDIPIKDFNKIPDFYSIIGNPHSLSESLSEDLDSNDYDDFAHDLYNSIKNICFQYLDVKDNISYRDIENAIHNFLEKYEDDEDFDIFFRNTNSSNSEIPGFEGTFDKLTSLSPFSESLNEELSQQGQKVLNELKKELGPELQKKVAFVIKDYANEQTKSQKQDKKDNLQEGVAIKRYSDVIPYEDRKYWYFTTHGVGPGSIPKDLCVLDTKDGQNEKGTWGTFVCLDGVLNTDELDYYDMKEMVPPENVLAESIKFKVAKKQLQEFVNGKMPSNWDGSKFLETLVKKQHITESQARKLKAQYLTEDINSIDDDRVELLKVMNETMIHINDEQAYMAWIEVVPDQASLEDFVDIAEDDSDFSYVTQLFNTLYEQYHSSGLVDPDVSVLNFCKEKDKELNLDSIEVR